MGGVTHCTPDVLVAIMEAHIELANRADEGIVAAQVHVELVVARELPAAAVAVHHVHHGNVAQLHSTHTGFRASTHRQGGCPINDSFTRTAVQPTVCTLQEGNT